jgi:hypothetical protein
MSPDRENLSANESGVPVPQDKIIWGERKILMVFKCIGSDRFERNRALIASYEAMGYKISIENEDRIYFER